MKKIIPFIYISISIVWLILPLIYEEAKTMQCIIMSGICMILSYCSTILHKIVNN